MLQNCSVDDPQSSFVPFSAFLDQILVFMKAYLMLHHQNILAVICAHPKERCAEMVLTAALLIII